MSWKCSIDECQFENEDDRIVCECCGHARPSRIVLTSPAGTFWRTLLDAEVTRGVYRRLYPDVEHQYVPRNEGEHPFSLVRSNTGEWQLLANPESPIRTILNSTVCEGGRCYGLNGGDVISIASPANLARKFAPLTVSFVPFEKSNGG